MSRYDGKRIARNEEISYSSVFEERGVRHIDHFTTQVISPINVGDALALTRIQHVWSTGDRLWKLAERYYADSTYWWLIAWYNLKPTESHYRFGDTVIIPMPLERALDIYNRGR